ncbi:amino acid adenylation domain-containing protein [Micromonospora echinospora]|uniref:amino acid adenylation domain-containing protein n=1 Tax=Micromonospora echinospora TaxID=1877 RepID=UPI003A85A57F
MSTSSVSREELLQRRLRGLATRADAGISRVRRDGALPVSFAQRRLWLFDQMQPGSTEYLMPVRLRLRGTLDTVALRRALDEIVARHEVLRTRYTTTDGEPVQLVDPPASIPWEHTDLSGTDRDTAERLLADLVERDADRPFDLAAEWPVRAALVRLADDEHVLLMTLHHIAADGWSESILLAELDALYAAFAAGLPAPLAPLPVQYADFAAWQVDRLSGTYLTAQLDHWRTALAGLTPLALPTDRPRPAVRSNVGAAESFTMPSDLAASLVRLGRTHGATPFMVLLAAFQVLLARHCGQSDVVVGSPVAGRDRTDVHGLIGPFVNMVTLRTEVDRRLAFVDLVTRVRETVLEAYAHQHIPFERLVDDLDPVRDPARTPLFQVVFQVEDAPTGPAAPAGNTAVRAEREPVGWEVAKYDLSLNLASRPDGTMVGKLEYATALFDATTVRRMVGHYLRLLRSVVADPDRPVGRLAMLTDAERRHLLAERSGTGESFPVTRTLPELFGEQARRTPDAVAVTGPGGTLTYAELDERVDRFARHLRAVGAGPQTLVGVCLDRRVELVVALLGVLRAGAGYLPLDPGQPADRLRYILDDAGACVVVTHSDLVGRLPAGDVPVALVDQDVPRHPDVPPLPAGRPDDVAYVIYTSGSTGRPKGVPVSHANVVRLFDSCRAAFRFGPGDVWTLFHSYAFDFSVWELWGPLLHGGRLVVVPFEVSRSPHDFLELLVAERVTVLNQTPSAFRTLVEAVTETDTAPELALRTVVFGGEALDVADLAPWFARFGADSPELVNMYGITETTVHVTYRPIRPEEIVGGTRSPIGRPLPDLRIYLLDDDLEPVPVGVPGQIFVAGAGLARGYLNRPALTADRFGPAPFGPTPGGRMYRTGDLARWTPDGELEFLGRADDQIKIRGHRIEPGEVEAAIRTHPDVDGSVVIAHRGAGDQENRLVAYVVGAEGRTVDLTVLREHLGARLPSYMVPAVFVPLDAIPITGNGKVDRRALPDPGTARGLGPTGLVAPRNPVEQIMAEAWTAALGVDAVGVHDNFFVRGGDSIRAIRVVGALRRHGIDVTVRDLLLHQSIDSLSRLVASASGSASAGTEEQRVAPFALLPETERAALPPDVVDAYPLSMVQAAMVYQMLADDDSPYHNITLFPIVDDAPFSLSALREAAALLASRHEILRTSFRLDAYPQPLQLVHARGDVEVGYEDLRGRSEQAVEQTLRKFTARVRRELFDTARAPMLRFHVHQTAADRWTFSFIECHAILDGWSHHSLMAELLADYRSIRDGRGPDRRPVHSVRYADFIALEQRSLASAADQTFWADRLARFEPVALPAGWAADPGAGERPYKIGLSFADLEPGLRRLAATAGVPLKSVLFGAHLAVLRAVGGSHRFHSGLVCNGRLETEGGEAVRGMHLNTLPAGVELTGATWTDLVRQAFAEEVAIWPHRRFPLPEIQRRWGDGTPLVEVSFTYLDFHVLDGDAIDSAGVVDVSPNEFALDTWTFPGALFFTARPERISRANGQQLARMYRRVLESMAADPGGDARGAALDEAQLDLLTGFVTGPEVAHPDLCVHELFEQQVARTPQAVAMRCADGERVSYAELDARANQLAHHLRARGVGPEDRVGLLLRRGPELIVALLAVNKAGAAYLPVDPNHPADRIRMLLEEARVVMMVTESAVADRLDGAPVPAVVVDTDPAVARCPVTGLGRTATPDALAYIIYTSGSTGVPKGVMIEHRNLVNYVQWAIEAYTPLGGTGAALYSSVAFDLPLTAIYPALLTGQSVTLTADDGTPGLDGLVEAMRGGGFGLLKATPTHVAILNGTLSPDEIRGATGRIVAGGEELTREMVSAWARYAPDTVIDNEYGPTETTVGCSYTENTADKLASGVLSIGRPIHNTVMRVLDADMCPTPVGVGGELYVGGAQVARGYVERPELTAERFVPDPYPPRPGARLYRTGDLARWCEDGTLEFLGRADHQVKVRGYRIELGEVEAALRRHADLRDVAVRVHTRPDGERSLVAYLVPTGELDGEAVAERMSRTMPEYLVPSAYVVLDVLPMTASGKVDAKALPAPGPVPATRPYLAPRTAVESILAGALATVLGLPKVGVDESFTALGVHSMTVMRLVVELREKHGLGVAFREFYQHRTVRELAQAVDPGLRDGLRPVAAANPDDPSDWEADALLWFRREGDLPPLFCVYPGGGQWYVHLAEYLPPGRPVAALEWPGMHRQVPSPQSIGQVAEIFLRQIRTVRPTGPYHLLGWCGSGPVTGEMAARLLREGERVTYVLLDPSQDSHTRQTLWEACAAFAEGEDLLVELDLCTDPERIAELQRRFVAVLDRVIDEGAKEPPEPGDTFWARRLKVWRELHQATLGHRQRPYPGQLHLLVGDELAEGLHVVAWGQSYEQYRQRWSDLTPGGLRIQRVGGDHLGVLKPPHVADLAGTLDDLMRRTERMAATGEDVQPVD